MSVSPESRSNWSSGAPRASAQIWVTTVAEPWPMSTAPWCKATRPSRFRPTRIVEGLGSEVLPQPYHIPATMRVGLKRDGRVALHQGAVDIGQGSATVVTQICAEALGAPLDHFDLLSGDTDITPDCGKTSASRQTFVSGKAALLAGEQLKKNILKLAGGCDCAKIHFLD